MKHYSLTYFLGQSFKGLWRNGVMTFASVTVLMSCLIVIGGFSLIVANIERNLEELGLLNKIVVMTEYDATEAEIAAVGAAIAELDNIESVEHITKAEALEKMKNEDPEYAYLYDDVTPENNPLSDEFSITYTDQSKASTLDYQLRQIDGVRKVINRQDIAMTLENVKHGVLLVFAWFLAILFVVSIFVIINTVKLAVFSRRQEITVMRYVGATGTFITLPFIFEGMIIGVLAAGLAYLVEWYIYRYIETMALSDLPMVTIMRFSEVNLAVLFGFLAIGILTGVIGSVISLRKYCKS